MQKSKYHLMIKGLHGKKKKFNKNGGASRWQKTRRRIDRNALR